MVNSKKMSKSSIAVIVLSILLVLSMILGLTGAWFTAKDSGEDHNIDSTFGTVTIDLTEEENKGTWSDLAVTQIEDGSKVLPGSSIALAGSTIANTGDVAVYVKVTIKDLKVTIAGAEVDAAEYFNETELSFEVSGATAVEGYKDMYLVAVDGDLDVNGLTLTLKDAVQNAEQEGDAYAANGAAIVVTYQVSADAIQADNIEVDEAATALSATAAE